MQLFIFFLVAAPPSSLQESSWPALWSMSPSRSPLISRTSRRLWRTVKLLLLHTRAPVSEILPPPTCCRRDPPYPLGPPPTLLCPLVAPRWCHADGRWDPGQRRVAAPVQFSSDPFQRWRGQPVVIVIGLWPPRKSTPPPMTSHHCFAFHQALRTGGSCWAGNIVMVQELWRRWIKETYSADFTICIRSKVNSFM